MSHGQPLKPLQSCGVAIHDVAADGQTKAKTAPVALGRKKGFKHICEDVWRHADAVVPDFNRMLPVPGSG